MLTDGVAWRVACVVAYSLYNITSTMINTTPPSVALIGCGPSGMFFLHALAIRRAKLEEEGNVEGLAALPVVTCFERSSGPGGVWRSDRFSGDAKSTNMYEALWTNGPKEAYVVLSLCALNTQHPKSTYRILFTYMQYL